MANGGFTPNDIQDLLGIKKQLKAGDPRIAKIDHALRRFSPSALANAEKLGANPAMVNSASEFYQDRGEKAGHRETEEANKAAFDPTITGKLAHGFKSGVDAIDRVGSKIVGTAYDPTQAALMMLSKVDPALAGAAFMTQGSSGAVDSAKDIHKHGLTPENSENLLLSLSAIAGGVGASVHPKAGAAFDSVKPTVAGLENRIAQVGSRIVKPSSDQVAEARGFAGDRFWYGRALRDIVRPLDGLQTVSEGLNKQRQIVGQAMEQVVGEYSNRGFYADASGVEAILDKAIKEAKSDPATANAAKAAMLERFKQNFFEYKNSSGQRVPKNTKSMTPSDLFKLKKAIGEFAYEQNGMAGAREISKQVNHELTGILKDKVPGLRELAEKDSQLITASDRINEQLDAAVAGVDVKVHDVMKVGVGEGGASVKAMAYVPAPVASWLTKTLATPSRTARIAMYRTMANALKKMTPQAPAPTGANMWPAGPGPGPGPNGPAPQPITPAPKAAAAAATAPPTPRSPILPTLNASPQAAQAAVVTSGVKPQASPMAAPQAAPAAAATTQPVAAAPAVPVRPSTVKPTVSPVETAPQGGHAGGTKVSIEEITRDGAQPVKVDNVDVFRRGLNYVVRSGGIEYHGTQFAPETIKNGEAHVTVGSDGSIRTNAGNLTPEMESRVKAASARPGSIKETSPVTKPVPVDVKPRSDAGRAALDAILADKEAAELYQKTDIAGKRDMIKKRRDAMNMQEIRGKVRSEKMSEAESVLGGKAGMRVLAEHASSSMNPEQHADFVQKVEKYVEAGIAKDDWELYQDTKGMLDPQTQRGWLMTLAEKILEKEASTEK